ncbi:MAG: M56 family metallopeptidase [Pirellulaceae bacterium]
MNVELIARASILILCVWGIDWLTRHRSAALRSSLWQTVMLGLLILPVIALTDFEWRVLPQISVAQPATESDRDSNSVFNMDFSETKSINKHDSISSVDANGHHRNGSKSGPPDRIDLISSNGTVVEKGLAKRDASTKAGLVAASFHGIPWTTRFEKILLTVWVAGIAMFALQFLVSLFFLRRLEKRCIVWNCPDCEMAGMSSRMTNILSAQELRIQRQIVEQGILIARQLGVNRPFRVLFSFDLPPMVWGFRRARVALPFEALKWEPSTLRSVLLHELSHVQRHDGLGQMVSRMACILHWINPLVWIAARSLERERERACDDQVLATGVRASEYATHLLQLVAVVPSNRRFPFAAVGMAGAVQVKSRIDSILKVVADRRPLTRKQVALAGMLAAIFYFPISLVGFTQQRAEIKLETRIQDDSIEPLVMKLFQKWWEHRRVTNQGIIPGGLINMLGQSIDEVLNDPAIRLASEQRRQLVEIRKVADGASDWKSSDARSLLYALVVLSPKSLEIALDRLERLHCELPDAIASTKFDPTRPWAANLRWSESDANGLRTAIFLHSENEKDDAKPAKIRGTSLECFVMVHNQGKENIFVSTENPLRIRPSSVCLTGPDGQRNTVFISDQVATRQTTTRLIRPGHFVTFEVEPLVIGKRHGKSCLDIDSAGEYSISLEIDFESSLSSFLSSDRMPGNRREQLIRDAILSELPLPKILDGKKPISLSYFGGLARVDLAAAGGKLAPDEMLALIESDDKETALEAFTAKLLAGPPPRALNGRIATPEISFLVDIIDSETGMQELTALLKELTDWDTDRRRRLQEAVDSKDFPGVRKIQDERAPDEKYVRLMTLASAFPESEASFESSIFILKTSFDRGRGTAMEILAEHHAGNSRLDEAASRTGWTSAGGAWAKRILEVNSNPSVQAHCKWRIGPESAEGHEPDHGVALDFYRSIIRDYGTLPYHQPYWGVPIPAPTFGELAAKEIRLLQAKSKVGVGKPLPDFAGVDVLGEPIALSDYKGKPTLIVCWATWCGPCLEMSQMERRFEYRYREQGLQILGVCCDFDEQFQEKNERDQAELIERVKKVEALHRIKWRSVRDILGDGNSVTDLIGSDRLPKTILIDADGVVRCYQFIDGTTSNPVAQEEHYMDEIEKVLGVSPDRTADLEVSRIQFRSRTAMQRYREKLLDILESIEQGDNKNSLKVIKDLRDSSHVEEELRPYVCHGIAGLLVNRQKEGKQLAPEVLECAKETAILACTLSPKNSSLLSTLSEVLEIIGRQDEAILAQQQACEYSHPCYLAEHQDRLKMLTGEK